MNEAIKIINLTKRFNDKTILNNVDLSVKKGEIYAFIGANGAGKTTLMKLLFGILKPDAGAITLLGETLLPNGENPIFSQIGNIIETPMFYNHMTAFSNLEIHCRYMGKEFIKNIPESLELVGLVDLDNKKVGEFSLGMKQRLAMARALIAKPQLLVLDEPINGMDPMGIQDTRNLLLKINKEYGTAMLISSHIISELAKMADTVGIIDHGVMLEQRSAKEILNELRGKNLELDDYFRQTVIGGKTNVRFNEN